MPGLATELGRARSPLEFGQKKRNPLRRFGSIAAVLLLHVVLIYALLNGLATKVVQVIQHPIETKIIEQVKPPPPAQLLTVQLPPPKFAPPPPPFVPSPEVQAPTPPEQQTITHQATPVISAPAVAAPPPVSSFAPPKTPSTVVGIVCPNSDQVRRSIRYPREAQLNNITGNVVIEFIVDPQGHVREERVAQSADPSLDRAALNAVKQFSCVSQGDDVRVQVPFSFNLN